jgi:hypothetical protein
VHNQIKIEVNLLEGMIVIFDSNHKKPVGKTAFLFDENQISVIDVDVVNNHKNKGYGKMMLSVMKGISMTFKKPIYLYAATSEVIPYYEKCGFIHLNMFQNGNYENQHVIFENLNPEKTWDSQVTEFDFVWIPHGLKTISLYL